VPQKDRTAEK